MGRPDPHPSGVHLRQDVPRALQRLADCQSGMLTREQVRGHDLSQNVVAHLIRSGLWQRVTPGLYLSHPLAPSWEALAGGGVLLGGSRARLGPEASGHLYDLVPDAPNPVDVLVPADKVIQGREHWQFLRERPAARGARAVGSPPRLSIEDTVLDLANTRPVGDAVGLVSVAVQNRLTTPNRLRTRLDQRSRHAHRALLLGMLADVAEGAESPLELLYLRTVERPHGLPRGDRQNSHRGTSAPPRRQVPPLRPAGRARRARRPRRRRPLPRHAPRQPARVAQRADASVRLVRRQRTALSGCLPGVSGAPAGRLQRSFLRCSRCREVPEIELAIA